MTAELDALKAAIELEQDLRRPTELELGSGLETGPMHAAHDAEVARCVELARAIVAKADT